MPVTLGLLVIYYGVHPQPVIDASSASIDVILRSAETAVTATKTAGL